MAGVRKQMSKDASEFGVDVAFKIWATRIWSKIFVGVVALVFLAVTVFA